MERKYELGLMMIGYLMYYRNMSKEILDELNDFELIVLKDDFERWLKEEGWEKKNG